MDYLFWRLPDVESTKVFPWILWNLWKARNEKAFSNLDKDPREILKQAEMDKAEWFIANSSVNLNSHPNLEDISVLWKEVAYPVVSDMAFTGFRCFVDGAWREADVSSGIAWYCFSDSVAVPFSGGRKIPRSLSALHSEFEAVLWVMECLLFSGIAEVDMETDCSDILKMINNPTDWPAFAPYIEDFSRLKGSFSSFSIHVIPRSLNYRADQIARNYRS